MKKLKEKNTHILTIRVSEETGIRIMKWARKQEMLTSTFVRMLILEYINKLEKGSKNEQNKNIL